MERETLRVPMNKRKDQQVFSRGEKQSAELEQGVARITHRDSLDDLVEKGRDLEKVVLSRAVRWHIENRILLYNKKTIIFE
jgi:formyltetrahydrofolate hydrolase